MMREIVKIDIDPYRLFFGSEHKCFDLFLDSAIANSQSKSYLLWEPSLVFQGKGRSLTLNYANGTRIEKDCDPLDELKSVLSEQLRRSSTEFKGCAGGYFSYDLSSRIEKLPQTSYDDLDLPEIVLSFFESKLTFDHFKGEYQFESISEESGSRDREKLFVRLKEASLWKPWEIDGSGQTTSNFTRKDYILAIKKAKDYIIAGDIFQVNLSQRFMADWDYGGDELYARLRRINPSPFGGYYDIGEAVILSSSPERFIKVRDKEIITKPIKGTRPRGQNDTEDERLSRELLDCLKDRAENIMIVDVERNDLGRISRYGSVVTDSICELEVYPSVFHLVSTVRGDLFDGVESVDIIRACFPSGSVTGAPKIRAMEIIDELEPTRRGPYTGSMGMIDLSGDMDLNILIRTTILKNGKAYYQAGGGIVADSDPEKEFEETLHKARSFFQAVG